MTTLLHNRATDFAIAALVLALAAAATPTIPEVRNRTEILASFGGSSRVHAVNFWATWCAPCVAEMPEVDRIAADYRRKGVEFVGVSLDDAIPGAPGERKEVLTKFLGSHKIGFRTVYYTGRTAPLTTDFRLPGDIPVTIVLDGAGRELFRNEGVIDGAAFRRKLDAIIQRRDR